MESISLPLEKLMEQSSSIHLVTIKTRIRKKQFIKLQVSFSEKIDFCHQHAFFGHNHISLVSFDSCNYLLRASHIKK